MTDAEIGFAEVRPLRRRALYARGALAAMVAVDLLAVISDLREYSLLARLETDLVDLEEIEASDRRQIIVALAQVAVFTVAAAFFIAWLHRAYSNLHALGAQYPRYSLGTTIWSWFVPILNLWRPKQVINDVWRASDPEAPPDQGDTWQQKEPPVLYALWWFFWVVLNFAYNADFRIYVRAETLEETAVLGSLYGSDRRPQRGGSAARSRSDPANDCAARGSRRATPVAAGRARRGGRVSLPASK